MNQSEQVTFSLDDLRVESFETLPEPPRELLNDGVAAEECFPICETGETIVCCYPTLGNGTGGCSMHHCSME